MDSSSAASRDRIKALYASREAMEHEMASIAQRLSGPGMPGLKGPLVDREGFPSAWTSTPSEATAGATPSFETTTPPSQIRCNAR